MASRKSKLFISYRRADSEGYAGRIHDRLQQKFGRDLLFMDVDSIPLGANFVDALSNEVAKCGVLLAIIGPNWIEAKDKDGNSRLADPNDFVRIEIAVALQRRIPVIPILLGGAQVPKADTLPQDIKELSYRNGMEVRHDSFHNDIDSLILRLERGDAELATILDEEKDWRRVCEDYKLNYCMPHIEEMACDWAREFLLRHPNGLYAREARHTIEHYLWQTYYSHLSVDEFIESSVK